MEQRDAAVVQMREDGHFYHEIGEKFGITPERARQIVAREYPDDPPPARKPERRCAIRGCDRPFRAMGLCSVHYERLRRGKPLEPVAVKPEKPKGCKVSGCEKPHKAKGYCAAHYMVHRSKTGDPCKVQGCDRGVQAKGYCGAHYARYRTGRDMEPAIRKLPPRAAIPI